MSKVNCSQGILRSPVNGSGEPNFLVPEYIPSNNGYISIDLNVESRPISLVFSNGESHYLIDEKVSQKSAWRAN
jgi:hypothetical protein